MPRPRVFDGRLSPARTAVLYQDEKFSTRQIARAIPSMPAAVPGLQPMPGLRGPGRWIVTSWLNSQHVALRSPQEGADLAKALEEREDIRCVWPSCRSRRTGSAPFAALCTEHHRSMGALSPGWDCRFGVCSASAAFGEVCCSYHSRLVKGLITS